MKLRRLGKSQGCRVGQQAKDPGGAAVGGQRQTAGIPSCSGAVRFWSSKAYNWLHGAHPHNEESSALHKVYWFKC